MARSEIRDKEGKILISKALAVPLALDFILRGQSFHFFEALHACIFLLETL